MIYRILYAFFPYALAGSGALLSELAGSLAIFSDGFMRLGSFIFWALATETSSLFFAALSTILITAGYGSLLSLWVRRSNSNGYIVALAVNVAASNVADIIALLKYGKMGEQIDPRFPLISYSPETEPLLWLISNPLIWLACFLLFSLGLFLYRSRTGLRLRALGLRPAALTEQGIKPGYLYDISWAAAAGLAGLAGAFFSLRLSAYSPGAVGSRGWISLAIIFMGQKKLGGLFLAALLFSSLEIISIELGAFSTIPEVFFRSLPNLLALAMYALQLYTMKKKL